MSDATAAKIETKHGIAPARARALLLAAAGLTYRWDDDAVRGRRALVRLTSEGRTLVAVLYPLGDDIYALGSIYRVY